MFHRSGLFNIALAFAAGLTFGPLNAIAAEGPALLPAEYKPLPVGTVIRYDDRKIEIKESDGFEITYTSTKRNPLWQKTYGLVGLFGEDIYATTQGTGGSSTSESMYTTIDDNNRKKIESLWPLSVGKKVSFAIEIESPMSTFETSNWNVSVKVARTESLKIGDYFYDTYVINENASTTWDQSYKGSKWYHPDSGLVIKQTREWEGPKGLASGYVYGRWVDGNEDNFQLASVEYPKDATGFALTRSREAGVDVADLKELLEKETAKLEKEFESKQLAQETEIARLSRSLAKSMGTSKTVRRADGSGGSGGVDFGRYYALVIGNNKYKNLPKLSTAEADALSVAAVLKDGYGFEVKLLLNATSDNIYDAFDDYQARLGPDDNLLIYYAGHGVLDEDSEQGYWLPVDADRKRRRRWISNNDVTDYLKASDAKHVMLVADSCFSGTLVRGAKIAKAADAQYLKRLALKRARVALTSGGLEPVADKGGGRHSPFAAAFLKVLNSNEGVLDGTSLYTLIRRPVMVNADQTPVYADVRKADHDGGDFLFVRKK